MALQSSPSSSSSSYGFDYHVFLSFRGSDTRFSFTDNLYHALRDKGIRTFIDDRELQGGEEITSTLFKKIEDSQVAIIVFSKNYASSSFCLDELVHIIECSNAKDQLILPVFYDVDPSDVRHQTGSYGEAIAEHEEKFQNNREKYTHNMERLQKWKLALNQAANLAGYHFIPGKEYESGVFRKIVDVVSNKINCTSLHVADYRVGLQSRVRQVKSLLDVGSDNEVYMVGIHGIGGIGKTTLAREIYNSIANQFEVSCFLDDVRQKTHQHGLVHLQETLLYETIGIKDIKLGSVYRGIPIIEQRLHIKKVLLILDDVDDQKQLKALVGKPHWLGPGSRVIITTRDKQLLASHGIERTYEVEELNKDEALELLRWKAFKNNKVDSNYEDILNRAVTYASGLPLALEVVGSNLCGKLIGEWESTLAWYKRTPHEDIQKILRVSFDTLDEDVQSVFLDIACCFKRYELEEAERILCAHHGHCIKHHIRVLVEKSLIKLVDDEFCVRLQLHDLIEDMGKDIVRRESPKEPGERSRLWFHEDIDQVLKENTGTSKIEIIHMDFRLTKVIIDWNGKAFKKMRKLKTLIIKSHCVGHFPEGSKYFPNSLRVLEWQEYPSQHIPSIFSNKKFENIKVLKFVGWCECLTEVPDVFGIPNLEVLSLRECRNLTTIHKSVGFLNKLKILDVESCIKLSSFPPIKLTSLQELKLSSSGLKSFPEILGEMKNITKLDLRFTFMKELPLSFRNLTGLCELNIYDFRLPIHILMMPKLSRIHACDCLFLPIQNDNLISIASSNVKDLHLHKCNLSDEILSIVLKLVANVEKLTLVDNFTILPECIKECRFLSELRLTSCDSLQEIRGIPPNLKYLGVVYCKSLSSMSRSMLLNQKFENMKVLKFDHCTYLTEVPDVSSVPNLEIFLFTYCDNLTTIHKSVGFLNKLKILNVKGCIKLRSFPPIKLTSLQELSLSNTGLESFPEILGEMKNLTKLYLQKTSIKELPFSFRNLTGLCELVICGLRFPIHILMMSKLSRIDATGCLFLPIQNDNLCSIASSNVKDLELSGCNLSEEILSMVPKLFANVEKLTLRNVDSTILPECIKECRFLSELRLLFCDHLQEIRGIPPNLKVLVAECCESLSSTCGSMLLNQKLHEAGGTYFRFPGTERIPEWFEHQSRGSSISFWFRNNIPSVALFFVYKLLEFYQGVKAGLFIDGDEYDFIGNILHMDRTYLFDLKLQDRGLESKLDEALSKNEWIHAEVRYRFDPPAYLHDGEVAVRTRISPLFESGIHVFKEKTNMEDIQFSNPYKQRKLDDDNDDVRMPIIEEDPQNDESAIEERQSQMEYELVIDPESKG